MGAIATEVQWKYRTISGAFLETAPPPPLLSLSPFLAKERNNLKDEFWWEMESECSTRGSVDTNFAWNKRRGVVFKFGCVIPVFSASMCVCTVYMRQCMTCLLDREKYRERKWTEKNKSNAILSEDALVDLDEKPLFHNYAIFLPPSPRTSISLTDFPLYKNHDIQSLVQGEHATVILFLNLRAPEKSFPSLSF